MYGLFQRVYAGLTGKTGFNRTPNSAGAGGYNGRSDGCGWGDGGIGGGEGWGIVVVAAAAAPG
jgi:hypothetical protein